MLKAKVDKVVHILGMNSVCTNFQRYCTLRLFTSKKNTNNSSSHKFFKDFVHLYIVTQDNANICLIITIYENLQC